MYIQIFFVDILPYNSMYEAFNYKYLIASGKYSGFIFV